MSLALRPPTWPKQAYRFVRLPPSGRSDTFFFRRIRAFELPPAQLQRSSARASIGLQNGDAPGILHRSGDIVLVTTGTTLMVMPRRTRRRKIHGCNYLKQKKRRADRHSLQFGRCALCTTPQMWKKRRRSLRFKAKVLAEK